MVILFLVLKLRILCLFYCFFYVKNFRDILFRNLVFWVFVIVVFGKLSFEIRDKDFLNGFI